MGPLIFVDVSSWQSCLLSLNSTNYLESLGPAARHCPGTSLLNVSHMCRALYQSMPHLSPPATGPGCGAQAKRHTRQLRNRHFPPLSNLITACSPCFIYSHQTWGPFQTVSLPGNTHSPVVMPALGLASSTPGPGHFHYPHEAGLYPFPQDTKLAS